MNKYKYLVMSGGGVSGGMLLGALKYMQLYCISAYLPDALSHMQGFAGTSIGALIALFCTLGLSIERMVVHMKRSAHTIWEHSLNGVQGLVVNKALCTHDMVRAVIVSELERVLGPTGATITFAGLFDRTHKDLVVCCLNLNRVETVFFRKDNTPDALVVDVVIASMSLPLLFPPIKIDGDLYVDGGIVLNFPISAFEPSRTLGLWLRTKPSSLTTVALETSILCYVTQLARGIFYAQDEVVQALLTQDTIVLHPPQSATAAIGTQDTDLEHMVFSGALVAFMFFRRRALRQDHTALSLVFLTLYFHTYMKIFRSPVL
jgi:predicted acylesterase/phospholipase RssA